MPQCSAINARFLKIVVVAATACSCGRAGEDGDALSANPDLALAETFVDAFYSFDTDRLAPLLSSAGESRLRMLEYQAWAEGGHYEVIERSPCEVAEDGVVGCSITVRDDLVAALNLGWWVTDHFALSIVNGEIVSVVTSSNDPQVYHDARAWVRENRADLIEEPCADSPETGFGLTPGLCAAAMTRGYRDFAESEGFPDELPAAPPRWTGAR